MFFSNTVIHCNSRIHDGPHMEFFFSQSKKKLVLDLLKYKYEVIHSLNVIQFDYLINCSTKV